MNDVKTEGRLYDRARISYIERKRGIFETLDHLSAAKATEVTARLRRSAIGVLAREGGEVRAVLKLFRDVGDLGLRFLFAARRGGSLRACVHEKDVRRVDLFCHVHLP